MGGSIFKVFKGRLPLEYITRLRETYKEKKYILVPRIENRTMHVLLKSEATVDDILCAYFHAVLLAVITCAINDEPLVSLMFSFAFVKYLNG